MDGGILAKSLYTDAFEKYEYMLLKSFRLSFHVYVST